MSQQLMQALHNWQEASRAFERMCAERCDAADDKQPAPPVERKKPDDTEGGTCD